MICEIKHTEEGFPCGAGEVFRTALVEKIAAMDAPCLILHGMAGGGKTVLLRQLLSVWTGEALLCTMDELDVTAEALAASLYRAATGEEAPALPYHVLLGKVCASLTGSGKLLVLDGLERLDDDLLSLLLPLLRGAGKGYRVIAASRGISGLLLPLMLSGACMAMGGEELLFTYRETEEFLHLRVPYFSENREVCRRFSVDFHEKTGGIPAVLGLLALAAAASSAPWQGDLLALESRLGLRGYLVSACLTALPDATKEFLLESAVLPHITASLCRDALRLTDGAERLRFAVESDLFLVSDGDGYRYPPLVRCVLLGLLGGEKRMALSDAAAWYYAKRGDYERACRVACDAENTTVIVILFKAYGKELLSWGCFPLLSRCADLLEPLREIDAAVLGVMAQCRYYFSEYEHAEKLLTRADSQFGKENPYSAFRALYHGLRHFSDEPAEYMKMINNAVFALRELGAQLPYLSEEHRAILHKIEKFNESEHAAGMPAPLEVRMFGNFSVIVRSDGKELSWRTKKGCELFAYLVSLEGGTVDRGGIFDVLWREELPNNAVAMLHNMIYNIRRELSEYGLENVIVYRNKRYAVDMSLIACDAEGFSDVISAVQKRDAESLEAMTARIEGCKGRYLAGIDSLWADEKREYYDRILIEARRLLAGRLMQTGRTEEALACLKAARNADPYDESLVASLLEAYGALGRYDKTRSLYADFCGTLMQELGVRPGAELQRTYETVMQAGRA